MPQDSRARHFPNSPSTLLRVSDVQAELLNSLTTLLKGCPPRKPWDAAFLDGRCGGLFTGPTSIALLFFHLSRSHPDLLVRDHPPAHWCAEYLACSDAAPELPASLPGDGCGITNEFLAFHTVSAAFRRDEKHGTLVVKALNKAQIEPNLNEWMKGRAGALYLLRFLKTYVPTMAKLIEPAQSALVQQLCSSRPWTFRDKRYFGAVHGDIGIITQAVLTDPASSKVLEADLVAMLDAQEENGNWPTREGGSSLVQFCHGAPGFIFSLERLRDHFPAYQERIDAAIARGRQCTWEEGLLTKEPSLCHGTTGNALALEGRQLEHFMAEATPEKIAPGMRDGHFEMSYDPWGLLWGEAGRAWSWAILDDHQNGGHKLSGVISYTDV